MEGKNGKTQLSTRWLVEKLFEEGFLVQTPENIKSLRLIIKEATEMEKMKIIDSHIVAYEEMGFPYSAKDSAVTYYKEIYGK
jgi:S-adenosylmethionine/arginine decarboxylase-like enzyme